MDEHPTRAIAVLAPGTGRMMSPSHLGTQAVLRAALPDRGAPFIVVSQKSIAHVHFAVVDPSPLPSVSILYIRTNNADPVSRRHYSVHKQWMIYSAVAVTHGFVHLRLAAYQGLAMDSRVGKCSITTLPLIRRAGGIKCCAVLAALATAAGITLEGHPPD